MQKQPIGIIGAMRVEVESLLSHMQIKREEHISSQTFYIGTLQNVDCVIAQCGPGKVNAAICAQTMILKYNPRLVINSGVAGGIGKGLEIGDLVVAEDCVQHDCDTTALGDPPGWVSGINLVKIPCDKEIAEKIQAASHSIYEHTHIGTVVTGDIFLNDRKKAHELHDLYGAIACEMEGGSVAHVCYMNHVPVTVVRCLSDKGDDDANFDYPTFVKEAADKLQKLLLSAIQKI